jgi:hypothetical protein
MTKRIGCLTAFAAALAWPGTQALAQVPAALAVPPPQMLVLAASATGVQIYHCQASKTDPEKRQWVFSAPEAELFDAAGKKIGKHYAGPTWELNDGSKVVGEVIARDKGQDADAIAWLLLKATQTSGSGTLGRVQSIQRLFTAGGQAPATDCDKSQEGREFRAPYRATYNFYALPK